MSTILDDAGSVLVLADFPFVRNIRNLQKLQINIIINVAKEVKYDKPEDITLYHYDIDDEADQDIAQHFGLHFISF
jgi:hypothetical protein